MSKNVILVTGSKGQIGTELTIELRSKHGADSVLASDIREDADDPYFITLDIMDFEGIKSAIRKHNVKQIYHLAAILSAKGEQDPFLSWDINMKGLFNVMNAAVELKVEKVFWPSSIAVFGPNSPKENTPQFTVMDPDTVYGISKLAGERWCHYYYFKFGIDVRSIRYPGLISYKAPAGGGTTDYAVDIYRQAIERGRFDCFLEQDTRLPMMYMPDAIRATIDLMEVPEDQLSIRSGYNVSGMSFTPNEIYHEIKKFYPEFMISYNSDFRQTIADSWPDSINDEFARSDWGWKPEFTLESMTKDMVTNLSAILQPLTR